MSRHLNGSPQPVDPVWYRERDYLHLACGCGHKAALQVGPLAYRHGLASNTRLYQLVDLLRCSRCGARPSGVDVKLGP
jgi:hypothetical protein